MQTCNDDEILPYVDFPHVMDRKPEFKVIQFGGK